MPKLEKLQLLVTDHNERESIIALQGDLFAPSLRGFLNGFSNCVVNPPRWDYPSLEAYTLWYPIYAPTLSLYPVEVSNHRRMGGTDQTCPDPYAYLTRSR